MAKVIPTATEPPAGRSSSSRLKRLPTWAADQLSKSKSHFLFGPRDDEEAPYDNKKAKAAAKVEIEASGEPGSPLVSVLMCMPAVLHILALMYGFFSTTWLCKPGDPCSLPTTAPVRLGSYLTFFFAALAPTPLHLTLLYATAMRHGSDIVLKHIIKENKKTNELDDLEAALLEIEAKKPSFPELVQTFLSYSAVFMLLILLFGSAEGDGSIFTDTGSGFRAAVLVIMIVGFPLLLVMMWFALRNMRVALIRRKRGLAPSHVRESVWPRIVNVVVVQGLLMLFLMISCLGSPQVPRTSLDGRLFEAGCPTAAINSTYIALHCTQIYATRLDKYVRVCDDGGYDRFPSMLDSCEAHFTAQVLCARGQACLVAGISALLVVILPDYAFGLKDGLTWSNWASKASHPQGSPPKYQPRIIGAVVFGFMGALCGIVELLIVIHPDTFGANEDLTFTGVGLVHSLTLVILIIGWVSCVLLLGAEFGVKKFAKLKELQEEKEMAKVEVQEQQRAGVVSFWFVKRGFILGNTTIPVFQEVPSVDRTRGPHFNAAIPDSPSPDSPSHMFDLLGACIDSCSSVVTPSKRSISPSKLSSRGSWRMTAAASPCRIVSVWVPTHTLHCREAAIS